MANASQIDRIFDLQSEKQWEVRKQGFEERKAKLLRLRDVMASKREKVDAALAADLQRPKVAGAAFELDIALHKVDETIASLQEWMAPEVVEPTNKQPGAKAQILYEPRGVVLLLGAWNFPFLLVFEPLIAAIAAGNCVIVKPAEMAPATSALIAEIIEEAFDESEVAVIEGDKDVAGALFEKPFDHFFLTGSPKVGRIVMAAAAKHLASVTLELGGKNPAFVDDSVDLDLVARSVAAGRFINLGQACMGADYIALPKDRVDAFVEAMGRHAKELFYDNDEYQPARIGCFIDQRNFERVTGYIDDAVAKGAKILWGGKPDAGKLTMEPTIIVDAPFDCDLMQEEIFGPVMVLVPYEKIEDVFPFTRSRGRPLATCIFAKSEEFQKKILENTSSGNVSVNGWGLTYFESKLPFGGVKESGIGAYHGIHGFRAFSHGRAYYALPAE